MDIPEEIQIPVPETIRTGVHDSKIVGLVGLASGLLVGSIVGYILGKKQGAVVVVPAEPETSEPEEVVTQEVDPMITALREYVEEKKTDVHDFSAPPVVVVEETVVNVFRNNDDTWNYEEEFSTRNSMNPYVIALEEFKEDEFGFHQTTVTYYEGDDVMVDESDTPIYNFHQIIGELKFGHGSQDKNVVYIRNEKEKQEWEVLRHAGHFAHEVLGLELEQEDEKELRHSVLRFRRD